MSTLFSTNSQSIPAELRSYFQFANPSANSIPLQESQPSYEDPSLGRLTRWGAETFPGYNYVAQPYYQINKNYHNDLQYCGINSSMPRQEYIRPNNFEMRMVGTPPVQFQSQYQMKIPEQPIINEPYQTAQRPMLEIPNYDAKFMRKKQPIEEIARNYLQQQISSHYDSQFRQDRDTLINALKQAGQFTQNDLQKPTSELVHRANTLSQNNDPAFGDATMNAVLQRLQQDVSGTQYQSAINRKQEEKVQSQNKGQQFYGTGTPKEETNRAQEMVQGSNLQETVEGKPSSAGGKSSSSGKSRETVMPEEMSGEFAGTSSRGQEEASSLASKPPPPPPSSGMRKSDARSRLSQSLPRSEQAEQHPFGVGQRPTHPTDDPDERSRRAGGREPSQAQREEMMEMIQQRPTTAGDINLEMGEESARGASSGSSSSGKRPSTAEHTASQESLKGTPVKGSGSAPDYYQAPMGSPRWQHAEKVGEQMKSSGATSFDEFRRRFKSEYPEDNVDQELLERMWDHRVQSMVDNTKIPAVGAVVGKGAGKQAIVSVGHHRYRVGASGGIRGYHDREYQTEKLTNQQVKDALKQANKYDPKFLNKKAKDRLANLEKMSRTQLHQTFKARRTAPLEESVEEA